MIKTGQGNFINGSFINQGSISLVSKNPSLDYAPVCEIFTDLAHVKEAVVAARIAYPKWNRLKIHERISHLLKLKEAFIRHEEMMAEAIHTEMGKVKSESMQEAKNLSIRIDLMITHGLKRVASENFYESKAMTRYHSQGVLLVIGPYNFPAHLVNSHVIPSILLGNTVIIKPSEICPWVADIYAQCIKDAGLPPGVVNIVHGDPLISKHLVSHPDIDGVLFTGSFKTAQIIKEKLINEPHKILALELGGKNMAVVMDDADIKQAVTEIITGAFLTTGQRCTATSRVLVHDKIFNRVRQSIYEITKELKPKREKEDGMFGPMATKDALDRFINSLKLAKNTTAEVLVESSILSGGAFVTPSLYQVHKAHPLDDYLGEELFGPNIALENFANLDEAIERVKDNPYGLSNAIFCLDPKYAEEMYLKTKCGVFNINRSTNNALGFLPFGGVNKSGNQRPAGIDAVRNATFPVAVMEQSYTDCAAPINFYKNIPHETEPLDTVKRRHEIESSFEIYGIYSDYAALGILGFNLSSTTQINEEKEAFLISVKDIFGEAVNIDDTVIKFDLDHVVINDKSIDLLKKTLAKHCFSLWFKDRRKPKINVPENISTPRSRNMLDRLYRGHFTPKDKKPLVADLQKSQGAFLASIDDDPLVLLDAASQIATLAAGFRADTFQNAYDTNELDLAMLHNVDLSLPNNDENCPKVNDALTAKKDLEEFLLIKTNNVFKNLHYGSSGAEANEIAFDLCRLNGPGGTKIIAFEGAFHGRTIMALSATYNKEKRGPFLFNGYEPAFIPFPESKDPNILAPLPEGFLLSLSKGEIPKTNSPDSLLNLELVSLNLLKEEILKSNVCCVIIEPMQCEGGDRYATNRFFCGLRALTRALLVPLIFDEVQTGFHLGRKFFWYQQMNLIDHEGKPDHPDCVTLAKKAQLGITLSNFNSLREYTPHVIQLKRALLHAQSIKPKKVADLEQKSLSELRRLAEYFPDLVSNVRACGLAFAFDMPKSSMANKLIEERFLRGFMAYIAGEKTLRFRLNMAVDHDHIKTLFLNLTIALADMRAERQVIKTTNKIINQVKTNLLINFRPLTAHNFNDYRLKIEAIEQRTYEEGRRDSSDSLLGWLNQKDNLGLILLDFANDKEEVAGYAIGGPLEYAQTMGPSNDIHREKNNTFYSANITIDDRYLGRGLGRLLKEEQLKQVFSIRNSDGSPRYLFMTGRNRIGKADAMTSIINDLGAYVVDVYDSQYEQSEAQAMYYRLPLVRNHHQIIEEKISSVLDCQNTLQTPFFHTPPSLKKAAQDNQLRSLIATKLTLSNWATPNLVRYSELLRAVMPKNLKHAYFTSGRDEMVDKSLRSLRWHRLEADIVIGFSHQWLGNITAASRSLSHEENQRTPFNFFTWPKVMHPMIVGKEKSLSQLNDILSSLDPKKVLGIMVELLGEKSGLTFDEDYLMELDNIRKKTGIPLVFVDNASSLMRTGKGIFLSDHVGVNPNMALWYSGGQLGNVMVDDEYFVEKPLTLISTWDGDEISMMRAYHYLLYASDERLKKNIEIFASNMRDFKDAFKLTGLGCYWALQCNDKNHRLKLQAKAKEKGVLFGIGFNNSLMICPKGDYTSEQFDRVIEVIKEAH